MNGPQDVGGRQGFGPIAPAAEEPVFHERWEARVFGLAFSTWITLWTATDEFRDAVIDMPAEQYYGSSYFERWLHALELLIERKGLPGPVEWLDDMATNAVNLIDSGIPRDRPAPADPVFSVGEEVRAKVINPRTYVRLPTYLKGRRGVIDAHYGSFPHPEDLARGQIDGPGAHTYRVRFSAEELWGPDAEDPGDSLCVDLFENYLEPA